MQDRHCHTSLLERLSDPRTLPTSTSGSSLGSAGPASPQTHGSQQVESTTPTRTPSPALIPDEREEEEPMETSPSPPPHPPSPPPQHMIKQKPPYMVSDEPDREREKEKERDREKGRERDKERNREKERVKERTTFRGNSEADSTTNNVISIPESEDMPNIEIISDGMDLLNTKFSFSSTTSQQPLQTTTLPAETPPQAPPSSTPGRQPATSRPSPAPSNRPPPAAAAATEPMEVDQNAPPAQPTHYITVSPLGKCGGSPRKMVIGRLPAPQEKKVTGREREYDPNRHCGVWDSEQKRNCTRSLTCKSHSVYLKRKVINRTGPFDELLAQHKAEKEATVVRNTSIPEMSSESSSSILATWLKLPTGPLVKQEVVGGRVGAYRFSNQLSNL